MIVEIANSNQKWNDHVIINVDASAKKLHICEKDYICNPATFTDYVWWNYWGRNKNRNDPFLMKNNAIGKTKSSCILFAFLLIAIALLIAVSIYCYLIKYQANQKHLLPYYVTNKKLTI